MDQSSFVDLLQETSADHVGHLEGSANHDFRQIRFPFVCIRVHPWPNCMSGARWVKISEKLLPGHGWTRIHTNFIILARQDYAMEARPLSIRDPTARIGAQNTQICESPTRV